MVYIGPNCFQVTGRDATVDYAPGTVVFTNGAYSGVALSIYSSGNTIVSLNDAVCVSGMSMGRVGIGIGAPLCSGGAAISGGESQSANNAFDGNLATVWASSQSAGAVSGAAYLGYNFTATGVQRSIRGVYLYSSGSGGTVITQVTSIKLRYSDNGSAWTNGDTLTVIPRPGWQRCIASKPAAAHYYWSILANSNTTDGASYWNIAELNMFE